MTDTPLGIAAFQQLATQRKLVCLTAYTAPMADLLDPHCDMLLVGDSVAMVLYGMDTTKGADMQMMIAHGRAVMRRARTSLVVVDMPAGSYEISPEQALDNASLLIAETGAHAVKLEGGANLAPTIETLTKANIPVLGHIGLLPQQVSSPKAYRITGRTKDEQAQLTRDAKAVQAAGAFGLVLEGMIEQVAAEIAGQLEIPTIGIGASAACSGQILVSDDMLGLYDQFIPRFVERHASLSSDITKAAASYRAAVIDGRFPADQHLFHEASMAQDSAKSNSDNAK